MVLDRDRLPKFGFLTPVFGQGHSIPDGPAPFCWGANSLGSVDKSGAVGNNFALPPNGT
jgi:hypothetical protein